MKNVKKLNFANDPGQFSQFFTYWSGCQSRFFYVLWFLGSNFYWQIKALFDCTFGTEISSDIFRGSFWMHKNMLRM